MADRPGCDRPSLGQGSTSSGPEDVPRDSGRHNPAKRLIGAKSADLASQSGRNWLSSGGHSRLWLIKSALKDKGSAFRQPFALPEFQSDQLKEDAACRFSFAITMSIKP